MILRLLSNAMNTANPTRIPAPSKRFRFGSTSTNFTPSPSISPRKISGRRWKIVSPISPPTAKATIRDREDGSILGGHNARRKLGGPEM
jgi:hypothetical protein